MPIIGNLTAKGMLGTALRHPALLLALGGGAVVASNLRQQGRELESEIMKNRLGAPGAKFVYAEFDNFAGRKRHLAEKLAFSKEADETAVGDVIVKGLAGGAAGESVRGLRDVVGGAARKVKDRLVLEPRREKILEQILTEDPTVSAYEEESPGSAAQAYSSMKRVAPELSTDPNVVLSYLREAAQTGGSTNYMTIKQLAETEAAINKAKGRG